MAFVAPEHRTREQIGAARQCTNQGISQAVCDAASTCMRELHTVPGPDVVGYRHWRASRARGSVSEGMPAWAMSWKRQPLGISMCASLQRSPLRVQQSAWPQGEWAEAQARRAGSLPRRAAKR
eukprot:CAMPEP_0171150766 /NCGR_PEP_ID=MMETSP0766_2-20121228/149733_1 /TAXON_ID=439317 /ORGANISM="Gambierdiscus australes, Strain CAWD 149" /LENGTH=122 /DNA_ID=CAMNT_0011614679 /DNA_START=899 /DNA_END=1264 /DNA_ORIENTATION=-